MANIKLRMDTKIACVEYSFALRLFYKAGFTFRRGSQDELVVYGPDGLCICGAKVSQGVKAPCLYDINVDHGFHHVCDKPQPWYEVVDFGDMLKVFMTYIDPGFGEPKWKDMPQERLSTFRVKYYSEMLGGNKIGEIELVEWS